ncbi:hypothetical protein IVB22_00085 [Bradyrhizobium sp. 190]|uniref:pYEATS domain-containing protein n=1 Tax=Bradyrhizobium sp. 190 TaxID=2782658 RepID=UPI001FF77DB1|nr:pYEATS domain-containing protein [Bradyrhizobium sp. 190]MCK1510996.1 hypothetical protein [Bradyrhizobium sp. 190]
MSDKPLLSQGADLLTALAPFSWPVVLVGGVYLLRDRLQEIVTIVLRRIESATDIEFGSLRLKGATITLSGEVLKNESGALRLDSALKADVARRDRVYSSRNNLMLVHTIKPVEPARFEENKYRVFGVSVFLHSHRQRGRFNDVKRVTYFLGEHWGNADQDFGAKYVIENGNEQFAMTAEMYGSCLCMAEIELHDGTKIEMDRYLDVEMAPLFGIPLSKARE